MTHPGMQDNVSYKEQPFAFGITLEKLDAHTIDEKGKPTFVTSNPMELLRKVQAVVSKMSAVLLVLLTLNPIVDKLCTTTSSSLNSKVDSRYKQAFGGHPKGHLYPILTSIRRV